MSTETTEPTGAMLIETWASRTGHEFAKDCPGCGETIMRVGITKLAYVHDACSCSNAGYEHLVERIWHRACLAPLACDEFRPFHVKGRRNRPAYDTAECHVCGRLEAHHP